MTSSRFFVLLRPSLLLLLLLLQRSSSVTEAKALGRQAGTAAALWRPQPQPLPSRLQQQQQQQQQQLVPNVAFLTGYSSNKIFPFQFSSSNSSSSSSSSSGNSSSTNKLRAYNGCGFVDDGSYKIVDPKDSKSSSSSSNSNSSSIAAIAAAKQQIQQQLASGAVKADKLLQELQQLQQQQQQQQQRPKSLEDLISQLAAARHGHFGAKASGETRRDKQTNDPVSSQLSPTPDKERATAGDPFSLESIIKKAKELRANLDTTDEGRRAFFAGHYLRELGILGMSVRPSTSSTPGTPEAPEALADRLALARAFAADRGPPAAAARGSKKQQQQQQQQRPFEARAVSAKRAKGKAGASGGRAVRQGPGRRQLGASLFGFPSMFDMLLGRGDTEDTQEETQEEQQQQQQQHQERRHPLEQLLGDIFGGRAGGFGALGDPAAAGDLLQQLFGDAAEMGGPPKKRRIDFLQPAQAEEAQQQQQQQGDSSIGWSEEGETNPHLLSLIAKAKAKGNLNLLDVLRRAFADEKMRSLAILASAEGLKAAQAKAGSGGRYLLARLHDEGLLP